MPLGRPKGPLVHGTRWGYDQGCRCVECLSASATYRAQRHKHDPEKGRQAVKRCQQKNREMMRELKSKPCTDCGVQYPYYVMQFDHVGEKSFDISREGHRVSRARILSEVAKCEVVCANCHMIRTYKRMQCREKAA